MKKRFDLLAYRLILVVTFFLSLLIGIGAIASAQLSLFGGILPDSIRLFLLLLLVVMICVVIMLLYHCFDRFSHKEMVISVCVMFGVMTAVFTVVFCCFRCIQYSDALNVQDMAMYFAKTGDRPIAADVPDADYFGQYQNNYFLTVLFTFFFKLLQKVGIHDVYGPLLLLTILGIMTAVLFMYLIGVRIGGIRTGAKILALCVLNPIYYVLVLWVYTNVISIPFMMAVIYFGVCMYQEKRRGYWIFACVLEGISSAVGYFIRPTAVIPLIAFVICAVLWAVKCKENVRRLVKYSIVCVIMAALVFSGISKLNDRFFSSVTDENFPVTHWLMMGSHGEGMHNYPDVNYTKSFETKKEKTHATVKKLISHYKEHGQAELVSFFYDKLVFSWSFGDGIEIIPKVSQDLKQTKLHSWIMGNRMDLFRLYCYAFRIANMILILIALWDLLKMKGIDAYQFVFVLSLFGGMLFYCLWEVKGSYTAPFVCVMLLIGMRGGEVLADCVPSIGEEIRSRKRYMETAAIFAALLCVCLVSYYRLTGTTVTHQDWNLRSYGVNSVRRIDEENGIKELTQEFYAWKPFNRVAIRASANKKAKKSDAGYRVKILDEMNQEVYAGEFHVKDILPAPDCRIILSTKKIIPKGKQRYRLVLEWLEGKSGKVYINQRSNEYIDTYEGVLTVNGKERMNDLYLQVYREYLEKWCSRKAGIVICGGIFAAALFLYLWLYTGGELRRILYAVRRTRVTIHRLGMR